MRYVVYQAQTRDTRFDTNALAWADFVDERNASYEAALAVERAESLDEVFAVTQSPDPTKCTYLLPVERVRSTSVGDVIVEVETKRSFMVNRVGFLDMGVM